MTSVNAAADSGRRRVAVAPGFLERAALVAVALACVASLPALWLSGFAPWAPMHPGLGLSLLCAVAALLADEGASRGRQVFARSCATLAILLPLSFLFGLAMRLDVPSPGMIGALLLGLLLPWHRQYVGTLSWLADGLALLFAVFTLAMLLGYLLSHSAVFGLSGGIDLSPAALACFLVIATAVIWRRSASGGMFAVLHGTGIGSRIARIAIPLAVVLPFALSALRAYEVSAGWLPPAYATGTAIALVCCATALLALLMAWRIDALEHELTAVLQRRSAAQLEESERRYMALVEQSIMGFVVRSPEGGLLLVNEAYRRMTGYPRDELLKLRARDLVVDQGVIDKVQQLRVGESTRIETFLKRKDGSLLEVEYVTQRLDNGDLQSVLLDVSERKRMKKARDEIERRYTELVEQAADSIWLRDRDGRMLLANAAACQLLGYSREELLQTTAAQLVHPSDSGSDAQIDSLRPGETLRLERIARHKDGHPVPVEVSVRRLVDGSVQVISHDISDRRRAEQARDESARRERLYMEELREMSRRLGEAQETERRAIAHELHDEVGQALTATRINLRDLEQQAAGGPLAARLTDTATLIAELLARVRQMSLDLHPSVLDDLGLGAALRWCVRTRATGSNIQVMFDVPEDLPRFAPMVEITLFRVFQEALSNVQRHAAAQTLAVSVRREAGCLTLTVKDDGKGFDAAVARREALSGKSLGLIGMQERVRLAGGDIALESAPGRGTEIRVSLPG